MTAFTRASAQLWATRAAPACASTARSCAGVRSRANRYAWIVFTPDRPVGGGFDRTAGAVRRGTAAVQAGAQRRQDLGDVADQVVVDLGRVDHQQPPALRGQRRLDVLGAEAGEPVTVLDHDRRHGRVTQQREELLAVPVQRGADLGDHPRHGEVPAGGHTVTRATCRSRSALWSADDTRAYTTVMPAADRGRPAVTDHDEPTEPVRGNRQRPGRVPPPRGHVRDALGRRPLLQVHPNTIGVNER